MLRVSSKNRSFISAQNAFFLSFSKCTHRKLSTALFWNASRLDYDEKLDFSSWKEVCDNVVLHRSDKVSTEEMISLAQDHHPTVIIAKEITVPTDVIQRLPDSVRLACEAGTGYNNWPLQATRQREIDLCNIPTYSTEAVAHMAITYLMNFSVSMFDQQRMLQSNDRSNFTGPFTLPLHEINDKIVGLVGGAGRIGTKVAEIALALGVRRVIISSRRGSLPDDHTLAGNSRVQCTSNMEELLRQSDYVSLHTPLNDETRGSFGRQQLEMMKPSAFLINTSRGAVCNENELIAVLKENRIAGAGLDVTTREPPPPDSKLWGLPNCWLSPHTGWRRLETRQRLIDMTADNIRAFLDGEPRNVVN